MLSVVFLFTAPSENHFIRKLNESKQTKQNGRIVTAAIFSRYERIRTCVLLRNTSVYHIPHFIMSCYAFQSRCRPRDENLEFQSPSPPTSSGLKPSSLNLCVNTGYSEGPGFSSISPDSKSFLVTQKYLHCPRCLEFDVTCKLFSVQKQ